ncbi:DNA repair protein XRCC2-like protein [Corchorus olitorius]|uniref:DNA repair protein XRCC2-like protein n=1 Tax=Corchorus olitorius TaxID=93759 RepID=A0A1R3KQ98_9ROSI|nr:DNA repair protein XRCC2-like protein [Corchorus olitorius]
MTVDLVLYLMALNFWLDFTYLPCLCYFRLLLMYMVLVAELAHSAGYSHCLLLCNLLMWPSGTLMMPIIKCHVGKIFHHDSLTLW